MAGKRGCPPRAAEVMKEIPMQRGWSILDWECGSGAYVLEAAEAVGSSGEVFAMDRSPRALKRVASRARRIGLENVIALEPGALSVIPDESLDMALLIDVYHRLADGPAVLAGIRRLLKPGGILVFSDRHLKAADFGPEDTRFGKLKALEAGRKTVLLQAS